MKNFMKLSVVLVAGALAFSSCNCFKKMAKNRDEVNLTVNPEVLTLNNGFVAADINVTFPESYFNKKAVVKVTPVIVFEGGEVAGTPKFYQGSSVDENYTVVANNGGSFTQHVEFPYDPRMDQCALQLRAEIKCASGGCKEFTLVNLNDGSIATKEQMEVLAGNDEAAKAALAKEFGLTVAYGLNILQKDIKYGDIMEPMANNYKRVTTVVDKTDLLYAINSSVVTKKNERKADLGNFKDNVDKNLHNDRATQNIAIKGYASPDGPEKFNDKLSKARSESGKKVVANGANEQVSILATAAKKYNDARVYNNLGVAQTKAGQKASALKSFEKAASLDSSKELNKNLLLSNLANGRTAEAKKYAQSADAESKAALAAAQGDYKTAANSLEGYNAAVASVMNNDLAAAKKAIAKDNSADADYLRAVIAVKEGDLNTADAQLKSAVSKNPALADKAAKDINLKALRK